PFPDEGPLFDFSSATQPTQPSRCLVGHGFSRDKNKTPSSHVRLRAFCASLSRQPWLLQLSLQLPPPRSVYVVIPLALTNEGTEARPCADEGPLFDFAFCHSGCRILRRNCEGSGFR